MRNYNHVFFALIIFFLSEICTAQTASDSAKHSTLNLYLNCGYCYQSFIKTEIKWVNYVRDRKDADVDLLITDQMTGAEGTAYYLFFIGNKKFLGVNDTLQYTADATNTEDKTRNGLVHVIKLGLMRYAAHTPYASQIKIGTEDTLQNEITLSPPDDPWKSWVFNISGNGMANGEKSSLSQNYSGSVSANKTTENIKIDAAFQQNYGSSRFIFGEDTINSVTQSHSASGNLIKSINNHWSYGMFANGGSSTFSNKKLYISASPALEYDVYPYSQSQRKQFTIAYFITANHFEYSDTTIYDKIKEDLFQNKLNVSLSVTQPWGSVSVSVVGSHYLNDFQKNNISISAYSNFRIFKGLSFNFFMSYELIHDQISLPKGGSSQEELLLRRKELETNYRYSVFAGLTYRFGSIYNNVVNPRLNGGE